MFNDYGLANIVWQRQRDAERAATAHRLVLLAERGARATAAVTRGSFVTRLIRRTAGLGALVQDLARLPAYAAEAERLHGDIRGAAPGGPAARGANVQTVRGKTVVRLRQSEEQVTPEGVLSPT